jgi:hypothetical protein
MQQNLPERRSFAWEWIEWGINWLPGIEIVGWVIFIGGINVWRLQMLGFSEAGGNVWFFYKCLSHPGSFATYEQIPKIFTLARRANIFVATIAQTSHPAQRAGIFFYNTIKKFK